MIRFHLFLSSIITLGSCANAPAKSSQELNAVNMEHQNRVLDYANDTRIEKGTKKFLIALNSTQGKHMEEMTPEDARNVLIGAQSSVQVDLSGIDVTTKTIVQDGLTVKLNIVRPTNSHDALPVFMFFHGGGWVLGDYPTHERLVHDLVSASGAAAVFANYTPSPEAHYPVAINEAYAATKWVSEHGKEIGVDGRRLAVVGNSVGGNMAAAVAIMAKDKRGPDIKLQVLLWPVTNAYFETDSYNEFAKQRFLTKSMMIWFWNNYTTNAEDRNQIYASPLRASLEQLKGLPRALVQTAENDVLRDEGEAYARKMDEAGVDVTLVRYQGMIHDYGLLNALARLPAVRSALLQVAAELKKI